MPLIVIRLEAQAAVTPVGKPVAVPIPVAPVVVCVKLVKAVLIQSVGDEDAAPAVFAAVTVMVPVAVLVPPVHPPVIVTVYVNVPLAVGVPLMVTTFPDQLPLTPAGNPVTVAPVAPVVAYVILVIAVLMHLVCASVLAAELKLIVLFTLVKAGMAVEV